MLNRDDVISILQDRQFKNLFLVLVKNKLINKFSRGYREELASFIKAKLAIDISNLDLETQIWHCLATVWEINIEKLPDDLMNEINKASKVTNLDDIMVYTVEKASQRFFSYLRDFCRNKPYFGLRQAIYRIDHFATIVKNKYLYFALKEQSYNSMPIWSEANDTLVNAVKNLASPKIQVKKEDGTWDYHNIDLVASDFWQDFIDSHCNGNPYFIPVYALFLWLDLHQNINLDNATISIDLLIDNNLEDQIINDTNETRDLSLEYRLKELRDLAQTFSSTLTLELQKICSLRFIDDKNLEEVAESVDLKSASSVTNKIKRFIHLVQSFSMANNITLEDELEKNFLFYVLEECKNQIAAPK